MDTGAIIVIVCLVLISILLIWFRKCNSISPFQVVGPEQRPISEQSEKKGFEWVVVTTRNWLNQDFVSLVVRIWSWLKQAVGPEQRPISEQSTKKAVGPEQRPIRKQSTKKGLYLCKQTLEPQNNLFEPLLVWRNSTEWLIKRCEQDDRQVRNTENKIIRRMNLRERTWAPELDHGQTPVLVFCVYASRIGIDIESALRGVNDPHPVVVVLHCRIQSSLPGDLSDHNYLLDEDLRNRVAGIAHFAFSDYDGFYSCRQNEDGFRTLRDEISKM